MDVFIGFKAGGFENGGTSGWNVNNGVCSQARTFSGNDREKGETGTYVPEVPPEIGR